MIQNQALKRCKLCKQNRKLVEAHIIPDFMYRGLFDNKHQITYMKIKIMPDKQNIKRNKFSAEYDPNILCKECDNNVIGAYESYAQKCFYNYIENSPRLFDVNDYKLVSINIDYKKFKLFLLSILWRMSITKRPFFKNVMLGPYEKEIGKMILDGDAKLASDFPIILWTYRNDDRFPTAIVTEPTALRSHQGTKYILAICGIIYIFHVSKSVNDSFITQNTVNENNKVSVGSVPKGSAADFLRKQYGIG